MKTRAAVAFEAGKPLEIVDVDLDGPKAGEVMVEIKATGVCHTDAFTLSGDDPEGAFPAILGHEGAGVVVEVGPDVKSLKPGDHVIPLYTAECRECDFCLNPKTNLCQAVRSTQGQGLHDRHGQGHAEAGPPGREDPVGHRRDQDEHRPGPEGARDDLRRRETDRHRGGGGPVHAVR